MIITSGPGRGKSTVGNIAAGRAVFATAFQPTHVTTENAWAVSQSVRFPGEAPLALVVHDTPGLDQDAHYPRHRAQLQRAFEGPCRQRQIVAFVLAVAASGRISANDVRQLEAIVRAYDLRPESVILVFNMMPALAPAAAEAYMVEAVAAMPPLLRPYAANRLAVPYLERLANDNLEQRQAFVASGSGEAQRVRDSLAEALSRASPGSYVLVRPEALLSAAETSEKLHQEKLRLERERQRLEAERRAQELRLEQARRQEELQRQENERLALQRERAEAERRIQEAQLQQAREQEEHRRSVLSSVAREGKRFLKRIRLR
ncbi:uncharacterized protein ACA1_023070 [Acanthamoeba castellanii str. Neff]|uniref:AIG1-type G domain-containing protein n=1 Tax=Acanthamoeba castellanii (strain ATCC 30010 / Neff) TaxID=1257118 RepID=L8HE28_ACACF|nr:uncharacterized protein ACA1_023070 [Acanthamoeba castellanii str. Neff]ELR23794.1 hypothetical protein ACA1_023070 [Acanthamoeba castellanii str. Neff]